MPAGTFDMGSPDAEKGRSSNEGPEHPVRFERNFAAGKFAVTFEEWDACAANGGCNNYRPAVAPWGRGRLPVINVSWHDAKAYTDWLSRRTGKTYRLLSEAEREYVARAGTRTPYWWGPSASGREAIYESKRPLPVEFDRTQPVGIFPGPRQHSRMDRGLREPALLRRAHRWLRMDGGDLRPPCHAWIFLEFRFQQLPFCQPLALKQDRDAPSGLRLPRCPHAWPAGRRARGRASPDLNQGR